MRAKNKLCRPPASNQSRHKGVFASFSHHCQLRKLWPFVHFSLCVHARVHVRMCVCVCVYTLSEIRACMWRKIKDINLLKQLASENISKTSSHPEKAAPANIMKN